MIDVGSSVVGMGKTRPPIRKPKGQPSNAPKSPSTRSYLDESYQLQDSDEMTPTKLKKTTLTKRPPVNEEDESESDKLESDTNKQIDDSM